MRRAFLIAFALGLVACSGGPPSEPAIDERPATTEARRSEPYAYVTPTPPDEATEVDGVYQRVVGDDLAGGSGACRRCPPYRMEEGTQTLRLERGVFFIENEIAAEKSIDWRSIGHYTVEGNTIRLFNDPNCTTIAGSYEWSLQGGELRLEVVDDTCAFGGLRWRYLTAAPWSAT